MKKLVKAALMHSAIGRWAGKIPFVRKLYIRYVWSGQMNALYGVFDSFPRAEGFAEGVNQVGWGNDAMAELLVRTSDLAAPQTFQTSQFAVMLWLSKLMRQGSTILDLGGSGGIFYEICNRYGLLNSPLRWHVVDMPDMVERGRQRHAGLQSTMISFGSVLSDAPQADIMLALGVLQYLPDPLGENGPGLLETLPSLPEHILINKIALTDVPDFWTAQNYLYSVCPYRFFNRIKFLDYFEARGYHLQDRWTVPEIDLEIPFHPERTMVGLEGLYLKLGAPQT